MSAIDIDPRLRWERPLRNVEDRFVNQMERDFAKFLDDSHIVWEYEPHFFFLEGSTRKRGCGYCPDFYLPEYDIYIEVYSANGSRRKSELRRRKQQRIRRLSSYSGYATVLIHPDNWSVKTADWAEVEYLIHRARVAAMIQRVAYLLAPEPSAWEL